MAATIEQLEQELRDLVKGVNAFTASGFSLFDIDDLQNASEGQQFPTAGVMYDGAVPIDGTKNGNVASPVAANSRAVTMFVMQFTVVIAIQYHYSGQDDTKPQATALLDALRAKIVGYKGANSRPWQFAGEKPEPAASGDGLAFYSQVWHTVVSTVGNFNNV